MLTAAHPWLALVLPLPLFIYWWWPAHREQRVSIRTPFLDEIATQIGVSPSSGVALLQRSLTQKLLLPLAWLLLVSALVQPQWVGEPIVKIESARDLMLLVDLSGSMDETDFTTDGGAKISRLDAVKLVLSDFIDQRSTDRLGLVVFGNSPFLQSPFTLDHVVFSELLDEVQVGMAGPQTMLGDALGLAVKAFDVSEAEQKTVILLTDGNDTGSMVPPAKAAELAAQLGVTVHVIGIGDPEATGEAPLDEATLRAIAANTGGRFFQAEGRESLDEVYIEINALEPLEFETQSYRPTIELYPWPLGLFLFFLLSYHLIMAVKSLLSRRAWQRANA